MEAGAKVTFETATEMRRSTKGAEEELVLLLPLFPLSDWRFPVYRASDVSGRGMGARCSNGGMRRAGRPEAAWAMTYLRNPASDFWV